jgi:glycosyltransferase involved in cell wall biosynthesis
LQTLSILIASRLARSTRPQTVDELLVDAAMRSIRAQTIADRVRIKIIIGIDCGASVPAALADSADVRIAESHGRSQAAALNAAAAHIEGDLVAFLEDDDFWDPHFIETTLAALKLKNFAFSSSTQLEMTEDQQPLRLKDFATMSGWVMPRKTWEIVGPFDESYRWHLDNEWLGRLAQGAIARCHLVEADTPMDRKQIGHDRPDLANLLKYSLGHVELVQHSISWPLVRRLVHPGSGIAQINSSAAIKSESVAEYQRLMSDFGRLPW